MKTKKKKIKKRTITGEEFKQRLKARNDAAAASRCLEVLTFESCIIDGEDFTGLDMRKVHFINCRMWNCVFNGARMGYAVFDRCDMKGSRFKDVSLRFACFKDTRAPNCAFDGAELTHAKFVKVDFKYSNFNCAQLHLSTATKCCFDQCLMTFAEMAWMTLKGCSMRYCRLYNSAMKCATISDADMHNSCMSSCIFEGATFKRVQRFGCVTDSPPIKFLGVGSSGGELEVWKMKKKGFMLIRGCFTGTLDRFKRQLKRVHGADSPHTREYLAIIGILDKLNFKK